MFQAAAKIQENETLLSERSKYPSSRKYVLQTQLHPWKNLQNYFSDMHYLKASTVLCISVNMNFRIILLAYYIALNVSAIEM